MNYQTLTVKTATICYAGHYCLTLGIAKCVIHVHIQYSTVVLEKGNAKGLLNQSHRKDHLEPLELERLLLRLLGDLDLDLLRDLLRRGRGERERDLLLGRRGRGDRLRYLGGEGR